MKKIILSFVFVNFLVAGPPLQKWGLNTQEPLYKKDTKGHVDRKFGIHNGNKLRTIFFNYGPIGGPNRVVLRYGSYLRLEWPAYSGHEYGYEMGPMIGLKLKARDVDTGKDTTIVWVDDPIQDGGDEDFEPLANYANPNQDTLAFSDRPSTWPDVWGPYQTIFDSTIQDLTGEWPGQFGPGVKVADQESFFIMTDEAASTKAFGDGLQDGWGIEYDPGNGLLGAGIQVTVRGYQWAASPAEDIIVWVYEVKNISAKDIDSVVVGYFGDFDIGGYPDYPDDMFGFDSVNNMVYNWDADGQSVNYQPGEPIGWLGFKFLESPGNSTDGIDNDNDNLIDESQYNDIDEDGDWQATDAEAALDPNDLDGLSDDVGIDGIPGTGDYGEGNGVPDQGEPDFGVLDLDEKDELGLTGVHSFVYGTAYATQDSTMWEYMTPGVYDVNPGPGDIVSVFSSGYFPLKAGQTERFSIAIIIGADSADMYANAYLAQKIYELNYRFARPPIQPSVRYVTESGKVILYWDDLAEKTPDPFLMSLDPTIAYDFEGYKVYRSEDRGVTWGAAITDAYGRVIGWQPLAQFDLIDSITGFSGLDIEGTHFYLGDDVGLQHYFIDSTVINGKHYWYAVTAYDRGFDSLGLIPLESPKVLGSPNVVEVVPTENPIGYVPPEVKIDSSLSTIIGTGEIRFDVLPQDVIAETYKITFNSDTTYNILIASGDTLYKNIEYFRGEDGGPFFNGIRVIVETDTTEPDTSYWVQGAPTFYTQVKKYAVPALFLPQNADYEIRFADTTIDSAYYNFNLAVKVPVNFEIWNVTDNKKEEIMFVDPDNDTLIASTNLLSPDKIYPFVYDSLGNPKVSWEIAFYYDTTSDTLLPPQAGDILYVRIKKPFSPRDTVYVVSTPEGLDKETAKSELDKIAVVPNPYVVGAKWELRNEQIKYGRGPMEIHFINLPPECTIRIYTLTGELVDVLHHEPGDDEYISPSTQKWNLITQEGQEIAYGIYIYHVDAPGIGEKIGKFAVIK